MASLREILLFRQFIMPYALQLLFWAAIGGTLYGTWWLYTHDNWAWIMSLTFGPLVARLIFESFILRYQTYLCLNDIRANLIERDQTS